MPRISPKNKAAGVDAQRSHLLAMRDDIIQPTTLLQGALYGVIVPT